MKRKPANGNRRERKLKGEIKKLRQKIAREQINKERETYFERVGNWDGKRKTSITEYYAIQKKVNRTGATQGSKARKHDRKEKPDKFFQISE